MAEIKKMISAIIYFQFPYILYSDNVSKNLELPYHVPLFLFQYIVPFTIFFHIVKFIDIIF